VPTEVVMPEMGESIQQGTITKWLVEVGSRVEKDQPLFEISTDKLDAEIPSPGSGVLRQILCPAGTTVPVNGIVAWITADMAEPVPAVETFPSFRPQASASSRATMPGAAALFESLHLTRSEERELRQIIGLDPPEPGSRFKRLFYGPLTGGQAILILIVLVVLVYVAWGLFNPLNPWGEILTSLLMPILMVLGFVGYQRCRGLVFKLYRALQEERQSKRTAGD
jgi:hypothetical protein